MNNSANNVVVITGASSGIGQAIALYLANKAFSLVLVARRLDRINALVDQIIQQGGIAAALPVFQRQGSGHFINVASVAGIKVLAPGGVVYSATKFAVRALSEGLRQEAGKTIRTTLISPGAVESELQFGSSDKDSLAFLHEFYKQAIPADAIARAVLFAIEQPGDVDINEIVVRPTQEEF
ncbi:SDR family oxidoreductase [Enterobacter kobei]|uniref:SDR family oxidoreductase n=1 Tax=Enterobacter kobei TaxID=208224 RepID=UPI0022E16376|nr:SDR family NAD(P)-dependent oxidoreductase [Enterobacter kobei]HCM9178458.1 SDR family NAD(P)-dependent oxidoreductase [Enterobacter kobei]HCM9534387.1 SDR family NAD(P)-dependent oxidoreductase [Enterobacter kobei]HEO9838618.1 SDR family NAD(P)-dependent oxidoreductase [Enterobacter kobei]